MSASILYDAPSSLIHPNEILLFAETGVDVDMLALLSNTPSTYKISVVPSYVVATTQYFEVVGVTPVDEPHVPNPPQDPPVNFPLDPIAIGWTFSPPQLLFAGPKLNNILFDAVEFGLKTAHAV